jgi:polyhydroxyalkanoate synthase
MFEAAEEKPKAGGSDWDRWLKSHSSRMIPVSDRPGNVQHGPIEVAPDRYVNEKSN